MYDNALFFRRKLYPIFHVFSMWEIKSYIYYTIYGLIASMVYILSHIDYIA